MAQSPEEMAATMRANVEEKTGHPHAHWMGVLRSSGLEKHGQMVKLLKADHGVTHGFANLLVHDFRSSGQSEAAGDPVDAHYPPKKAHLRPIYDAVTTALKKFGDDIELAPKKTYVSVRRSKQFATLGPATNSAFEVGLNMPDTAPGPRLLAGKGMVSHRVRLGTVDEVDAELLGWLRQAYDHA